MSPHSTPLAEILFRCSSLIFFKSFDKVAQIIEARIISNLGDGLIGGKQLIAGAFYTVVVEIIDWRAVCHLLEKAAEIFTGIADNMMRNINWYFRLNPVQLASVETELLHDMQVLNQVLLINKHYNPEFNKKYQEEFDNYRMAYESVRRE